MNGPTAELLEPASQAFDFTAVAVRIAPEGVPEAPVFLAGRSYSGAQGFRVGYCLVRVVAFVAQHMARA